MFILKVDESLDELFAQPINTKRRIKIWSSLEKTLKL
tara:strand:- start:212 stop:322 length:111 start_codon:yes stop_codon:yes gene_type:complete